MDLSPIKRCAPCCQSVVGCKLRFFDLLPTSLEFLFCVSLGIYKKLITGSDVVVNGLIAMVGENKDKHELQCPRAVEKYYRSKHQMFFKNKDAPSSNLLLIQTKSLSNNVRLQYVKELQTKCYTLIAMTSHTASSRFR